MKVIIRTFFVAGMLFPLFSAVSSAVTITPNFVNSAGQTWTADRVAVVNQAISDWQTVIGNSETVNVTFDFTNAGTGGYLGQWSVSGSGIPWDTDLYPWTPQVTQTIHINADRFSGTHYTWWDPTPVTGNDLDQNGWDALSVVRHEIGHMMGIVNGFYQDNVGTGNVFDKWGTHITGSTFDSGGLNVALASTSNLSHLLDSGATAGDLMVPALINNQRRGISKTDLNMLYVAYNYDITLPTTYSLIATAGKTLMHKGDTCTITAKIANIDGYAADSLDFTGLRANASAGTVSGASTSGGPLAKSGGNSTNAGLTFNASTAGSITITPVVTTAANHTLGTAATLSNAATVAITVYSGQSSWNSSTAGNWSDPAKWNTIGGVPGVDGILSAADTATFSRSLTAPIMVNLNGATPRLAALTLNNTGSLFTIAPGDGGSLTMNAATGDATISVLRGPNLISAPLILGSNTTISGAGAVDFSGGITGNHTLTVTGSITASRIQVDTLQIGANFAAAVPEPCSLALFGLGTTAMLALMLLKPKR
jgi:hypothetical protein